MGVAALVNHGVQRSFGDTSWHAEVWGPLTHGRWVVLGLLGGIPVRVGTSRRVHGLLLVWVWPQLPWLLLEHEKMCIFHFRLKK